MSYNLCILMGNVTRDPELKFTPNGTACCDFGIAVNKVFYNDAGDKKESVSFFDVVAWDKGAEWAKKYLKKGAAIHIQGELRQDQWEDKESGQKRSKVRIVAQKLTPCFSTWNDGHKPKDEDAAHTQAPNQRQAAPAAQSGARRPPPDPDGDAGDDNSEIPF